jgi:hypothetical protein
MARMINPIWTPTRTRERQFLDDVDLWARVKLAVTKSSNIKYSSPIAVISPPPIMLFSLCQSGEAERGEGSANIRFTFSVFIAGRRVKVLMAPHDRNHSAERAP